VPRIPGVNHQDAVRALQKAVAPLAFPDVTFAVADFFA
jgi:hypothetical protein